jgi:hypothetical protein
MSYTIKNPEINKLYLVKRNVGGPADRRYQPARVLEIDMKPDDTATVKIGWLYDDKITTEVWYEGLVHEITKSWLSKESDRVREELFRAKRQAAWIDMYSFVPSAMAEITL